MEIQMLDNGASVARITGWMHPRGWGCGPIAHLPERTQMQMVCQQRVMTIYRLAAKPMRDIAIMVQNGAFGGTKPRWRGRKRGFDVTSADPMGHHGESADMME
jgi:hypothetical protein